MQRSRPGRTTLLAACLGLLAGCPDTAVSGDGGSTRSTDAGDAATGARSTDAGDAATGAAPIACDVELPTACSDPDIAYADVAPIIERRCLSCHDGTTAQWPLTDYAHVADWFVEVRSTVSTCSMPPPASGITMPNAERETLLLWIRCGYHR